MPKRDRVFVSGGVGVEIDVTVPGFPLDYAPIRHVTGSLTVAGGGWNLARVLRALGTELSFATLLAGDAAGQLIRREMADQGLLTALAVPALASTPLANVLVDPAGARQLLLANRELGEYDYPAALAAPTIAVASFVVLCNVGFTVPLIAAAQSANVPIAVDVQVIERPDDPHNRPFLEAAKVVFLSHEGLVTDPAVWITSLWHLYSAPIVVVGLGAGGALLGLRESATIERIPAVPVPRVINTIGAGDALFAGFIHFLNRGDPPRLALERASHVAARTVGCSREATPLPTEREVIAWHRARA